MNRRCAKHLWILLATSLAALTLPMSAPAHVTLQPGEQPAGEFVRADVRVPTEGDSPTKKVVMQFPPGFLFASYEPVTGWEGKITTEKLPTPVPSPEKGEPPIKEQVKLASFTATDGNPGIGPGQFQDFGLSLLMPKKPGTTLTFKAIEISGNGEVVRWIGPPDSDEPAPQVKLVAAADEADASPAAATSSKDDDDDDASKGLGIAALALGALGLLVGGVAMASSRRRSA